MDNVWDTFRTGQNSVLAPQAAQMNQAVQGMGILSHIQQQQQQNQIRGILANSTDLESALPKLAQVGPMGILAAHQLSQVQEQQAKVAQAKREQAFFSPENQARFTTGGTPAKPAITLPEDPNNPGQQLAGPVQNAQPAVPGQFNLPAFAQAGIMQGIKGTEPLLNHLAQREANMNALQARLYDIQTRSQDRTLTLTQQADLAKQANETKRYLGQLIASTKSQPAPSLATIQDPNDPTKNIIIDAKTNRLIGNAPKDRAGVQDQGGKETVTELVTKLGDYYNQLNEKGAITNTQSGALPNVLASAGTSSIGQTVGRTLGTENQSTRDKITSTRPLLLQAIRKATGMTAKAMDSNVELQLYLRAATDPTMGYQANKNALQTLDKLYGLGGATDSTPAPAAPVKITNDSQYNSLPSGATYIAPDGSTRTKK